MQIQLDGGNPRAPVFQPHGSFTGGTEAGCLFHPRVNNDLHAFAGHAGLAAVHEVARLEIHAGLAEILQALREYLGTADALDYDLRTAAVSLQIDILCIAAVQVAAVVARAHIAVAELQMLAPRIARNIKFLYLNVTTFVTSEEALPSMRLFKGTLKNKDDCSIAILARPSTALCPITDLAFPKRKELYGVRGSDRRTDKRANRLDTILAITKTPCSLQQVARKIHLKPKYTQKHVNRLVELGLIVKKRGLYQSV